MGDEALFEKTNTLNKVGEIIHLLLIYIKKNTPQFIMFVTVVNGKICG